MDAQFERVWGSRHSLSRCKKQNWGGGDELLIKLTLPFDGDNLDLSQFTGNNRGEIEGCRFVANSEIREVDAWFVFDGIKENDNSAVVSNRQVHFVAAETAWGKEKFLSDSYTRFLKQFWTVNTPFEARHPRWRRVPAFLPWMVNANHGSIFRTHHRDLTFFENLEELPKSAALSVFCSSQAWRPGHQQRLDFTERMVRHFGGDMLWFGNGINPVEEKWEGLAPFQATVVLENRSDPGMITEKILDPFLSLSEPIYWGAPDVKNYLPLPDSHTIDISDFSGAVKKISEIAKRNVSSSRPPSWLLSGKERVLRESHFLRRLCEIAKSGQPRFSEKYRKSEVLLRPVQAYSS